MVVAVLVLGAATGCEDDEHFPPGEGGGPSGGGGSGQNDGGGGAADAGTSDASTVDGGAALAGELCDVTDVRSPLGCANVDLTGIEVRAVGSDATDLTNAQGDFTLSGEFETDQLLSVGRDEDSTRLSLVRVEDWDLVTLRIPRVDGDAWNELLGNIGTNEEPGTASIALFVVAQLDGLPVPGAQVSAISGTVIFYDDDSVTGWTPTGATGLFGAALILSVPAEDSAAVTVNDIDFVIPLQADHLTFARIRV